MFKPLVVCRHKLFRADNAGIGKITRTISEAIAFAEFKLSAALFFEDFILNDLDAAFFGLI